LATWFELLYPCRWLSRRLAPVLSSQFAFRHRSFRRQPDFAFAADTKVGGCPPRHPSPNALSTGRWFHYARQFFIRHGSRRPLDCILRDTSCPGNDPRPYAPKFRRYDSNRLIALGLRGAKNPPHARTILCWLDTQGFTNRPLLPLERYCLLAHLQISSGRPH